MALMMTRGEGKSDIRRTRKDEIDAQQQADTPQGGRGPAEQQDDAYDDTADTGSHEPTPPRNGPEPCSEHNTSAAFRNQQDRNHHCQCQHPAEWVKNYEHPGDG